MNSTAQQAIDPKLPAGPPLKTALKIVSRSTETRASNEARAWLVVADVTPTGYSVGIFMAKHARYAKPSDIRRNVVPGEIFCYWPQAKIAAGLGCSERQVRRGVRSLREAGALEVRRRVRPCEASYVWVQPVRPESAGVRSESAGVLSGVRSDVLSGVRSHTEPRTNHEGTTREPEQPRARGRITCNCGNSWPDKAEYGKVCYPCRYKARETAKLRATVQPTRDKPEPRACTCGENYHQAYAGRCVECNGVTSAAQRDALREKDGGGGARKGGGVDGGGADPSVPETDERAETADQPRSEPGPNETQFYQQLSKWRVKGATT